MYPRHCRRPACRQKKRARSSFRGNAIVILQKQQQQLVHGDVDGALAGDLVGAVLRRRLLLLGRRLGVRGLRPAAASAAGTAAALAVAVEAVAAGAAAGPRALALRRGVGRLHGGRLPPAELRGLGAGRRQLLELGPRGRRRFVVEARHRVGLEGQALPQLLQSLFLLFLQIQRCTQKRMESSKTWL